MFTANKKGIKESVLKGTIVKLYAVGIYESVKYEYNFKTENTTCCPVFRTL